MPRVQHLCNLVVVKRNIVLSNAKIKRDSAISALNCIEENKVNTMVKSSSPTFCLKFVVQPEFFGWYYPQVAQAFIIYQTTGHLQSVRLFAC